MPYQLALTQASGADAEYLYNLAEATMRGYVEATWGEWDPASTRATIDEDIAHGRYFLIWLSDATVGTISVEHQPTQIQLHKLYIEPAFQGRGIGTQLLQDLIGRARADGKPLRLRVLAVNPARRLYERLGFVVTETTPERHCMECR